VSRWRFFVAWVAALWCLHAGAEVWECAAPPTAYRQMEVEWNWSVGDELRLPVRLMGDPPGFALRLAFYFQTRDGLWVETREDLVLDGTQQSFRLSLAEDGVDWRTANGDRPYGRDLLREAIRWGLRLYAPEPWKGRIDVGGLELVARNSGEPVEWIPRAVPSSVSTGEVVALRVEPWNWTGDRFDAGASPHIEVRGEGEPTRLPAVWVQEYRVRRFPGRREPTWSPWRRPVFRALWRPSRSGRYAVRMVHGDRVVALGTVEVRDGNPVRPERTEIPEEFLDPPANTRVWRAGPDGGWEPESIAAVWTPDLDWTATWGSYAGLGEFVQPRAARFEAVVAGAAVNAPLRIVTEELLNNSTRLNWKDHPWNADHGGPLLEAREMWKTPEWRELIVRRARYLWGRYGAYPQVTGLYIDVSRASSAHVEWIVALRTELEEVLPGVRVWCPSPGLPERREEDAVNVASTGWGAPEGLHGAKEFAVGETPLQATLSGASEQGFDAGTRMIQHWSTAEVLRLDVEPLFSFGVHPSVQVQARTRPDCVFTTEPVPLHNWEVNRIFIPLDDPSAWRCFQEPDRPWSELERMNVREVLLRVYTDRADPSGRFRIVDARVVSHPLSLRKPPAPLSFTEFHAPAKAAKRMERMSWRLGLNRFFRNPYDEDEIAVDLEVTLPDGRRVRQPGFFYRGASRRVEEGVERWELEDAYDWRVRFRPWLEGTHEWTLIVRARDADGGEEERLAREGRFEVAPAPDARGFVVQSERDPRYFEFQDGTFFYPIGHTMRSPSDRRGGIYAREVRESMAEAEKAGTEIYDRWFKRLREEGGNFARVWISNWWLGLEWNSRHDGYHGRGYFNQLNAARLDRILELAETYGVYLNLETMNHGAFSSVVDGEWEENPWSAYSPDEGPVSYASDFFVHEEAMRWHRLKLRYLMARAGHSPMVAFWGVVTESEWTEPYYRSIRGPGRRKPYHPRPFRTDDYVRPFKEWTARTARDLKELNAHPVVTSTHFSNPRHGHDFWRMKDVSVVHNNAYRGFYRQVEAPLGPPAPSVYGVEYPRYREKEDPWEGVAHELYGYDRYFRPFARDDRILLVGEWGGDPMRNRDSHLMAEFHTGNWILLMTNASGISGYWWYNLVDHHDLYTQYRAVAAFMKGEDLRGRSFECARWPVWFHPERTRDQARLALGKSTTDKAFVYVFSSLLSHRNRSRPPEGFDDPSFPESGPGVMSLPETLREGVYAMEVWNTFTGEVMERREVIVAEGRREVLLPPHRVDLAMKFSYSHALPEVLPSVDPLPSELTSGPKASTPQLPPRPPL